MKQISTKSIIYPNGYSEVYDFNKNGDKTHYKNSYGYEIWWEYDKDGNTFVYVKNGENLKMTTERLLGKDAPEEQVNAFKELNKDLIKTYQGKNKTVEAFDVGAKIRIPMELQYNEETKAILTVDPEKEIAEWKKDISAGAVMFASFISVLVGVILFGSKLFF